MIFLDTANLDAIKRYARWGIIRGVTTNPKIISREHEAVDYSTRIREILEVIKVPVSVEITNINASLHEIIDEAYQYYHINPNYVVIKVPMFGDGRGLIIASELLKRGIPINMTCIIGVSQAILACELGCKYVSIFYNRIIDYLGGMGAGVGVALETIKAIRELIDTQGYHSKIIAGSIRKPEDVIDCLMAGAHIVTVRPDILQKLPYHHKTEQTIKEFDEAYQKWLNKKK